VSANSNAGQTLVEQLIRPEVRALSAYHVPDPSGLLKLDAMENPYGLPDDLKQELATRLSQVALNRYPLSSYASLKQAIAATFGVPKGFELILGNGSDELISLLSIACAKPGAKVLAPVPSFVMYGMSALFAGLEFVGVPLTADFTLDLPAMLAAIRQHQPAMIYLAYPNNPTGGLFDADAMLEIIRAASGSLVIVDEAYQPFAQTSFMARLAEFPNLIVMRTVSKLGLAGIRLGYMTGNTALMQEFEKVRPPYNINVLTQAAAEFVLQHVQVLEQQAAVIREQRSWLAAQIAALPGVTVYPSAANFVLIRVADAERVCSNLLKHKILIKNVGKMHKLLENCLRITVSSPEENTVLLAALRTALE
jgi:histidinol-phosphate aminotransferase